MGILLSIFLGTNVSYSQNIIKIENGNLKPSQLPYWKDFAIEAPVKVNGISAKAVNLYIEIVSKSGGTKSVFKTSTNQTVSSDKVDVFKILVPKETLEINKKYVVKLEYFFPTSSIQDFGKALDQTIDSLFSIIEKDPNASIGDTELQNTLLNYIPNFEDSDSILGKNKATGLFEKKNSNTKLFPISWKDSLISAVISVLVPKRNISEERAKRDNIVNQILEDEIGLNSRSSFYSELNKFLLNDSFTDKVDSAKIMHELKFYTNGFENIDSDEIGTKVSQLVGHNKQIRSYTQQFNSKHQDLNLLKKREINRFKTHTSVVSASSAYNSSADLVGVKIGTDLGLGITFFENREADMFTYSALKFYFFPYDKRMVHPWGKNNFFGRTSFLFGVALSGNIFYKGQQLDNTRIGVKPLMGISIDVTKQFTFSGGLLFFNQSRPSPFSGESRLRARGFVSVGFDFDAINFLIRK